ncbi:Exodeoxyribonuclease I protein [Dioscorea alata]|uniref:Exodeoxyribonuclease I protein n=1 Tax=Dioscorea alata TaxID=55571 RepID=A0ACB7U7W7_DIOAL|nr:Exodeoxyribonuclease I protein [Dioscorea alata]
MEMDASPSMMPFQAQLPVEPAGGPEIAFFDLETTMPLPGSGKKKYALLEFGAILVCPKKLVEVGSYSTLIRPSDISAITAASIRCNGICPDLVASAPLFHEVADEVFRILHGRVWAGHNILRFDCVRIQEAFEEIGRPPPQPRGTIDTLSLLTQKFGKRAGNMKMDSLAAYFGLGRQMHRSLGDVRMNLEILKYCATVLFLESNYSDMFPVNSLSDESTIPRNNAGGSASPDEITPTIGSPSAVRLNVETNATADPSAPASNMEPIDLMHNIEQMRIDQNESMENFRSTTSVTTLAAGEGCSQCVGFSPPEEVSTQCVRASLAPSPFQQSVPRIVLLHKDTPLQLCQMGMKILFGLSTKFADRSGWPKLSFMVYAESSLRNILDLCDNLAESLHVESSSSSQWRPVINTSYANSASIRLHIPTVINDYVAMYSTEIYLKEPSGNTRRLVFSQPDAEELEPLIIPGNMVDAYFNLETYDFQEFAGIRLVAKTLVLHAN